MTKGTTSTPTRNVLLTEQQGSLLKCYQRRLYNLSTPPLFLDCTHVLVRLITNKGKGDVVTADKNIVNHTQGILWGEGFYLYPVTRDGVALVNGLKFCSLDKNLLLEIVPHNLCETQQQHHHHQQQHGLCVLVSVFSYNSEKLKKPNVTMVDADGSLQQFEGIGTQLGCHLDHISVRDFARMSRDDVIALHRTLWKPHSRLTITKFQKIWNAAKDVVATCHQPEPHQQYEKELLELACDGIPPQFEWPLELVCDELMCPPPRHFDDGDDNISNL